MNRTETDRASEAAKQLERLIPFLPVDALVNLVMIGNDQCHSSLAAAEPVEAPVSAALAEMGNEKILVQLLLSPLALIPPFSMIRIIERFSPSEPILGAFEARSDLNDDVWAALGSTRLKGIVDMIGQAHTDDMIEQALIALLWATEGTIRKAYISSFIRFGCMTPNLVRIALSTGASEVVGAILSVLTGKSLVEIDAIFSSSDRVGFADLLSEAGFPLAMIPVCEITFLRATTKSSGALSAAA